MVDRWLDDGRGSSAHRAKRDAAGIGAARSRRRSGNDRVVRGRETWRGALCNGQQDVRQVARMLSWQPLSPSEVLLQGRVQPLFRSVQTDPALAAA